MMLRTGGYALLLSMLAVGAAVAQDVPGIEICTAEKTMERRTSCLQSNIDFLKRTMTQDALTHQQKLDAAVREIVALKSRVEALSGTVVVLQKTMEQLQAQQGADKKPRSDSRDVPKDTSKEPAKEPVKDAPAK